MKTPAILLLWLASFAADNLWRIVMPLTDRMTARVSYALAWGVLAAVLAYAYGGRSRDTFNHVAVTWVAVLTAYTGITAGADAFYVLPMLLVRAQALVICLCIVERTTTRVAFAAAVGLAGGHALALGSFLISRVGPILLPDAGSQLAMRYGPWASAVEGLGCVLIMALALSWASRPGATAR